MAAALAGIFVLAACHTDPFSMKPEVNVTLPEKPAPAGETGDEAPSDPAGGDQTQ